jgi:hypothetical protein
LAAALAFLLAAPHAVRAQAVFMPSRVPPAPLGGGRVTGRITAIVGATMQLALRNGNTVAINLRAARAHGRIPLIYAGELVEVQGTLTAGRAMTAAAVMRAKSAPAAWSPDIR